MIGVARHYLPNTMKPKKTKRGNVRKNVSKDKKKLKLKEQPKKDL